jgi:hypothetical protein
LGFRGERGSGKIIEKASRRYFRIEKMGVRITNANLKMRNC